MASIVLPRQGESGTVILDQSDYTTVDRFELRYGACCSGRDLRSDRLRDGIARGVDGAPQMAMCSVVTA